MIVSAAVEAPFHKNMLYESPALRLRSTNEHGLTPLSAKKEFMILATLCYVKHNGKTLIVHRNKK